MHTRLTTLMALAASLSLPVTAMAQEAVNTNSNDASASDSSIHHIVKTDEANADAKNDDANADAKNDEAKDDDDKDDDKSWTIGATLGFDLGLGAFTKHEYAKRIRSRFKFSVVGSYTIPVIDVDIYAQTGFSQWMSKAGGSNGQYEFRWADSEVGLTRNIWSYKSGDFKLSFDAALAFTLPTSTASINTKLYTTIAPSLSASFTLDKFTFAYAITYGHNFHKFTSTTLDPSEVDVLSRSTGEELLGEHAIAIEGVLTEIELANQFAINYQFIKQFGMTVGLAIADGWTYDNGTITKDDEFVSPYAKVGRGHSQYSSGSLTFTYVPIKYVALALSMVSTQPWKTADNKTLRFPWFDTVSPSKNFTKFMFTATFTY
ncbi:MAG: hypothetical protein II767_10070 [Proteobacteria bacterium]|nr:hypothetical protein [Pseudomonadota bacterium]MBQ4360592.1 hypothetical protein [Pseudomonadota bacterium]